MKRKIFLFVFWLFLFAILLVASSATAQTIAYRQTELTSNVPNLANNVTDELVNPWGITYLAGQPFFIANYGTGRVTLHDATGSSDAFSSFLLPNIAGTGFDHPTGIVADANSFFGGPTLVKPLIVVTDEGSIFESASSNFLPEATLVRNDSSSGVAYKGVAIVNSPSNGPVLAVTDFHGGGIATFLRGFLPLGLLASAFNDPNLPPGYAPFGIQVIGAQVFVTYALQDAAKRTPVFGAGNGVVSIFDLDGNFVRRFATGGPLNAPWGITQASANFGPFSNDILIGNVGDGMINAFDLITGSFVGEIKDGSDNVIDNLGLHGLTFRADGVGDPNTLYLIAGIGNGLDGIFAAISPGLVSVTEVSVPATATNTSATITVTVSAGPGNTGVPTGTVTILNGGVPISSPALVDGQAMFSALFTGVGTHVIEAQYKGDANFLPSISQTQVQITGPATMVTLGAPVTAVPGSPVILTATIHSTGGTPTGNITFHDDNAGLGTALLNASGVATLTISTLTVGTHSLTADYAGDGTFGGSTSAAVTITIANKDFSLGAAPGTATVMAGQSAQFMLTITPAGGFTDNVTFFCTPTAGIACAFNPATVTPANGAATTTLTVTTSATGFRNEILPVNLIGPDSLLAVLVLFGLAFWHGRKPRGRASLLTATAVLAIVGLSLTFGGCGGYGNSTQPSRGTASIMVTAQSGAISHSATVSVTVQ